MNGRSMVSKSLAATLLVVAALAPAALAAPATPATAARGTLRLPPLTKHRLPNGLTVLVMPTHRLPLVDFHLVAHAGSAHDPSAKEGLASLTAELLTQGAGKRNAKQIAEDIAFVGGSLGASASAEQLVVTCEVLKKDFATGLELFRDVIVNPTFPAEEFQRKQAETLGAIAAQKDDPSTVANNAMLPFYLGSHPLAHPAIGWAKSVTALTREDAVAYHHDHLTPDRAILAVVGDVEPKQVIAELERAFATWKPSGHPSADAYSAPAVMGGRQVLVVKKPEVTQTQIRLIGPGVPRSHPDFYPLVVANTILGAGFTSRLVNEIRVTQGLTYSIGSRFLMYENAGVFRVSTFTKNETLRKTIDETMKVVKQLADQGPTQEELDKAHRYLTGQFPLDLQAPDDLAGQIADVEFYGLPSDYLQAYRAKIDAVTMTEVKRVLHERFKVEDFKVLVVSQPELAQKALSGLGPIAVQEIR